MAMTTNPRTGLREGYDGRYKLPVVHQRSVGQIRFDGQPRAIHTVSYRPGESLDFYSRLAPSEEIVVAFHSVHDVREGPYPVFAQVANLASRVPALLSFADPSAHGRGNGTGGLPWYLGGPGWDPLHALLQVVRKAQGRTGARHIAFVGVSGGGFAALRASAMVRGSLALVSDPTTSVQAYGPRASAPYFENVWPGWERDALVDAFPDRFDMARHYATVNPENHVFYVQNSSDFAHVRHHLEPFRSAMGIPSGVRSHRGPRRVLEIYDGRVEGHGRIEAEEMRRFFDDALEYWRHHRELLV